MRIEGIMKSGKLPRLYRVIKVDLDVLRPSLGANWGVIFDCDDVVERKVRRVACESGWKWQLVQESKDQEVWDYYIEEDRYIIDDINFEYRLTQ